MKDKMIFFVKQAFPSISEMMASFANGTILMENQ